MIFRRYQDFRAAFALVGASIGNDGFPVWPVAKLRSGGFSGGLAFTVPIAFPFRVTCNLTSIDTIPLVDDYDWYVSQRTDDPLSQYLTVSAHTASHSGTISIDLLDDNVVKLLPSANGTYTGTASLKLLFKNVSFYVQRRDDKAIQRARFPGVS